MDDKIRGGSLAKERIGREKMRRFLKYYISLFLSIVGAILIWETFQSMIGGSPLKAIFVDYRLYVGIILLSLGFLLYKPQTKTNGLKSK